MTRAERAKKIGEILDRLYPEPGIPLQHRDAFTLLVAVLLSAQTTDAQVNRVTPALFERAPDAERMARMTPDEILLLIRSCGLAPGKARNLQRLAEIVASEHGGRVPADLEALERLPGVGHKTASVVMAQAFGLPAFPVDTHIHRLAARWRLSSGRSVEQTEHDLKKLFPAAEWGRRHLQMIYFGREHCPARGHDPASCAICSWASSPQAATGRSVRRGRKRKLS
ncbi:MAG TPA: endonuclease III [Thermoanaerobaculia bacterium]|nr:endonuclease III [Thermoanaerobaculia bacterium]